MRQYSWLFLLCIIILIDNIANSITLPVSMHFFSIKSDMNNGTYSLNVITYASGLIFLLSPASILASPLLGWLSDNVGRKSTLILCLVISLLGYSLLLIANFIHSMYLCLFSILLFNSGSGSMVVVQANIADISQGKLRAYFLGIIVAVMLPIYLICAHVSEQFSALLDHQQVVANCIIIAAVALTAFNVYLTLKLPNREDSSENTATGEGDFFSSFSRIMRSSKLCLLLLLLFILQLSTGLYNMVVAKYQVHYYLFSSHSFYWLDDEKIVMLVGMLFLYPLLLNKLQVKNILFLSIAGCLIGIFFNFIVESASLKAFFLDMTVTSQCFSIATLWLFFLENSSQKDWGLLMGIKAAVWSLAWLMSSVIEYGDVYRLSPFLTFFTSFLLLLAGLMLVRYSKINKLSFM